MSRGLNRRLVVGVAAGAALAGILLMLSGHWSGLTAGHKQALAVRANLVAPAQARFRHMVGLNLDLLADSRFMVTSNRLPAYLRMPLPGMNPAERVRREIAWSLQKPNPRSTSLFPSATQACSINGLLSQCTEITGVRFIIQKEVAVGSVQFGHSNTLNGSEWAQAFTDALRTKGPEWWDAARRGLRRENLVLLTRDGSSVLVLPSEMAPEFREQGFKNFQWGPK